LSCRDFLRGIGPAAIGAAAMGLVLWGLRALAEAKGVPLYIAVPVAALVSTAAFVLVTRRMVWGTLRQIWHGLRAGS